MTWLLGAAVILFDAILALLWPFLLLLSSFGVIPLPSDAVRSVLYLIFLLAIGVQGFVALFFPALRRYGAAIEMLVVVQVVFFWVGHMAHPTVVEPQRPLESFPMVVNIPAMGAWEGKDAKLDERSFNESEADIAVSRIYTKEGRGIKLLLAEYQSPRAGLYHNPMNCYHTQGFTLGHKDMQPLKAANRPDTDVSVSTWTRNSEKVIVAYWYEIGDQTLYERQDLLKTQWAMAGKTKWPVMFKVLLEMPADAPDQSKTEILDMAQVIREWLGYVQPVLD